MFKNQAVLKPALFKDQGVPVLFPWHWAADLQEETGSGGCQVLSAMLALAGRTQHHSKASLRCCSDENTMTRLDRKKRKLPVQHTW